MSLARERDLLKRKMAVLEREVEAFKSFGKQSKKLSRVARFAQEPFKPKNWEEEDKENRDLEEPSQLGGISYFIE
jgi:hypothetical protein